MAISKPAKPYTFSNGTTADATEVNSDFDTLYAKVNEVIDDLNTASATIAADLDQAVKTSSSPTFVKATLTQSTGTAPLTVTSTTRVTNLNADKVDGYDFDQDLQSFNSPQFVKITLSQGTGTAPLTVTSTTKVANLNADKLDDQEGSYYLAAENLTGTIDLARIPATLTGKDADTLDGQHGSFYQSASNISSGTLASARMEAGAVVQVASYRNSTNTSSTATFPAGIPQITDGVETVSLSFTPKFANSKILLQFSGYHSSSTSGTLGGALFTSESAAALVAAPWSAYVAGGGETYSMMALVDANSTSARTYSARAGGGGATINTVPVAYGGVAGNVLTIMEIKQ